MIFIISCKCFYLFVKKNLTIVKVNSYIIALAKKGWVVDRNEIDEN